MDNDFEETAGRQVASRLGIEISGIAGQILKAFRNHLIGAIEAKKTLSELFQSRRKYQCITNMAFHVGWISLRVSTNINWVGKGSASKTCFGLSKKYPPAMICHRGG